MDCDYLYCWKITNNVGLQWTATFLHECNQQCTLHLYQWVGNLKLWRKWGVKTIELRITWEFVKSIGIPFLPRDLKGTRWTYTIQGLLRLRFPKKPNFVNAYLFWNSSSRKRCSFHFLVSLLRLYTRLLAWFDDHWNVDIPTVQHSGIFINKIGKHILKF